MWLSWLGPAVGSADRARVLERDVPILSRYFSSAAELQVDPDAARSAVNGAALYDLLRAAATTVLHEKLGARYTLDFENRACVAECTHYRDDAIGRHAGAAGAREHEEAGRDAEEDEEEEETVTDDFYSEYFIFQLETGCYDAELVMDYLRRYRGDVQAAAAAYRRELTSHAEADPAANGVEAAEDNAAVRRSREEDQAVGLATQRGEQVALLQQQQQPGTALQVQVQVHSEEEEEEEANLSLDASEFWTALTDSRTNATSEAGDECDTICAICLAGQEHGGAARVQLGCSHMFHHSCIKRCVDLHAGALCCPLCRCVTYTTARRRVMEASAEAEAAAAAVVASGDRHRQRLQERLQERRAMRAAAAARAASSSGGGGGGGGGDSSSSIGAEE